MVTYEWVVEQLDGPDGPDDEPEIIDVNHADTYAEAKAFALRPPAFQHYRIALVRDRDDAGYSERAWAYVEGDMLPSHLEDAYGHQVVAVPQRFRRQFDAPPTGET